MPAMPLTAALILLVMIVGLVCSGVILFTNAHHRPWYLRLLDSNDTQFQLHLYFGAVALFSLFFYSGYAVIVRHFPFGAVDFGKGTGIIITAISMSAIGDGLQHHADPTAVDGDGAPSTPQDPTAPVPPTPTSLSPVVTTPRSVAKALMNMQDSSLEMHLFLGAFAIIVMILYSGYDLAYNATSFNPSDYAQAVGCCFVAVGLSSWGQGVQRKLYHKRVPEATPAQRRARRVPKAITPLPALAESPNLSSP